MRERTGRKVTCDLPAFYKGVSKPVDCALIHSPLAHLILSPLSRQRPAAKLLAVNGLEGNLPRPA